MNKNLIKQYSDRATEFALTKTTKNSDDFLDYYNTKFVELIVNECSNICSNFKYTTEGPSENAAYQRALCGFYIKEYFGYESPAPLSPKVIR